MRRVRGLALSRLEGLIVEGRGIAQIQAIKVALELSSDAEEEQGPIPCFFDPIGDLSDLQRDTGT